MTYEKIGFDELPAAVREAFAAFESDNTAVGSTTARTQYRVKTGKRLQYAVEVMTGGLVYYRPDGKRV